MLLFFICFCFSYLNISSDLNDTVVLLLLLLFILTREYKNLIIFICLEQRERTNENVKKNERESKESKNFGLE